VPFWRPWGQHPKGTRAVERTGIDAAPNDQRKTAEIPPVRRERCRTQDNAVGPVRVASVQDGTPRRPVEVNLEAAPAIAQQLRLRNLAGAVVIDFVTMRSAYDRDKVQAALAEALAADPVPTQIYGFTRLGLFELTRARRGPTLASQLEALEKSDD